MKEASQNATEELLVDFLENEVANQDKNAIRNELRGSVKLRRTLEALAAVRFEIANAEFTKQKQVTSAAEFTRLHKKIMTQIEKTEAASSASRSI